MIEYSREMFLEYYRSRKLRLDGRRAYEYREIVVRKGIIATAEGSGIARVGDTVVIAGVKIEYGDLFEEAKGNFVVNIDLSPIAHQTFVSGPPDERSIELSRVVDRGFRSAEVVALERLATEPKRGYTVYLDMYVLDYDGNAVDAAYLAGMAALLDMKIPKYTGETLDRSSYLEGSFIQNHIFSSTFAKIDDVIILDPTHSEMILAQSLVSIVVDSHGNIVGIQKSGEGSITRQELGEMIKIALKNRSDINKLLIGDTDAKG
ncbi:MAG: hypothetical protein NZ908_02225 [Candidatus Micrarchaeota archaeon]|nr:hypothetical protein [Candidatus Micrarchaeota archaeon]MCX8154598.1 hypothetical protein [Candidatus Micrarchaeota archaeon]